MYYLVCSTERMLGSDRGSVNWNLYQILNVLTKYDLKGTTSKNILWSLQIDFQEAQYHFQPSSIDGNQFFRKEFVTTNRAVH